MQSYEIELQEGYLAGKYAEVSRRNTAGEVCTTHGVQCMMVEILGHQESIYDPTCGMGGMPHPHNHLKKRKHPA